MLYEGQRLSQALQRSVATMVTSCVQKQLQDSVSVRANLPAAGVIFGQQLAANGKPFVVSCGMCLEGIHAAFEWDSVLRDKLQSELFCKPHTVIVIISSIADSKMTWCSQLSAMLCRCRSCCARGVYARAGLLLFDHHSKSLFSVVSHHFENIIQTGCCSHA